VERLYLTVAAQKKPLFIITSSPLYWDQNGVWHEILHGKGCTRILSPRFTSWTKLLLVHVRRALGVVREGSGGQTMCLASPSRAEGSLSRSPSLLHRQGPRRYANSMAGCIPPPDPGSHRWPLAPSPPSQGPAGIEVLSFSVRACPAMDALSGLKKH